MFPLSMAEDERLVVCVLKGEGRQRVCVRAEWTLKERGRRGMGSNGIGGAGYGRVCEWLWDLEVWGGGGGL